MKRFIFWIYIGIKSMFGTKIEGVDTSGEQEAASSSWYKQIKKGFLDIYNVDHEDKIDYTNTHADHHSNFKHLDDPEDERFDRLAEQKGLIYEADGNTPKNAAEMFDMTYEEYEDYKKKILPHAKDRRITEEEIAEFLGKEPSYEIN